MGNLSKYFYEMTRDKTCRDMLHPGYTCAQAAVIYVKQGTWGAMRHYLPTVVTALLFRMNQWDNPDVWMQAMLQYGRCILAGLPMTAGSFHFFCGFYNLLGRFSAPFFVFVPSFLGGCTCMFLPRSIIRTQGIGLFNTYVEFLIRRMRGKTAEALRVSRLIGTIAFSLMSAAIMPGLQYLDLKNSFWFAHTYDTTKNNNPTPIEAKASSCPHHPDHSCFDHVLKESKRSFYFGCAIWSIKNILPRVLLAFTSPVTFVRTLLSQKDYGLIAFFSCYKAFYESMHCLLIRKTDLTPLARAALAGLVAGIAYRMYPSYVLFTYPISQLVEIYWKVYMKSDLEKPRLVEWIDRLPMAHLVYCFALGMMYHLRVVYPYHTNRICHKVMNIGTTGRSEMLARGYAEIMLGLRD
ncbi:uncharacterized protein LOC129739436 [Uranotaenia lowii]|uniref:uncharacterized protein LOC129739436 n=1 Tax=Uranotaenia lowii TaxID=190385 RepID=UPI002478D850|nr:uncharacterized protein LOC129739436 [Uranotaenia lowii]